MPIVQVGGRYSARSPAESTNWVGISVVYGAFSLGLEND
jgi:hypothetical protein